MTNELSFEAELYSHPAYLHYAELNQVHSATHRENSLIKENIWPFLTGQTLVGEDKISLRSPSLYVIDDKFLTQYEDIPEIKDGESNSSYTFFHLGHKLSGHAKIIHGGLLATILDELTCRLAFQNFHLKKGVTANLNINYFKPCFINSYVMIKCTTVKKNGRKCVVKGQVYHLDLDAEWNCVEVPESVERKENLLTECECLVIEPRWVHDLKDDSKHPDHQ